ncbi:MAG: hypothetical protein E7203_03205 [Selenomonas ruminantium]|jgi:type I restriction enzyme S subunit|uniref:Type I restriction modification DNA specificity domain-containing protein n=1 Tax=Selenomonas ruminantium TaxID=971 RepID=A0A927WGS0_SELRU|nr:restriction endonuclease subunit S [Selenomonas ruminantium]MBE6084471.1 hypothetical protein [Selenomonas ruminantium]
MAKKQLTIEEKLQAALVPAEEQPYKVPDNWCWVRFDVTAELKKGPFGSSLTKAMFVPKGKDTYKVYEQGNAIRKTTQYGSYYITEAKYQELKNFAINDGDIIVSCAGTVGELYKLPSDCEAGVINQALMRVRVSNLVNEFYFINYFSGIMLQDVVNSSQGTAIKNIPPFKVLKSMPFPMPPQREQSRIVARIESLFAKLDEAKEKIQEVLDGADLRRAAILYQAFSGKLTEKWREKNDLSMIVWEEKTLQDVCSLKITDGTHKTPTYTTKEDGGIPFISAKDVTQGEICWDNIKYIIPELHEELYSRLAPQRDDVLLAKNGTTGVAAIVDTDKVFDLYVTLAVLRPNQEIICPRYLLRIVNSPICKRQFDEHLTGIGVPNLHLRDIKGVVIKVPSISEQQEIVRLLDNLLTREQSTVTACEEALTTIDTLKKSILARAFRGELGTNDPADPSAQGLLQEILEA